MIKLTKLNIVVYIIYQVLRFDFDMILHEFIYVIVLGITKCENQSEDLMPNVQVHTETFDCKSEPSLKL